MDYHQHGLLLTRNNPAARTISAVLDNKTVWYKYPVPPKTRIWHILQRIAATATGMPIIRSTLSAGGGQALRDEASRLQNFQDKGFHAPAILAAHDDMIVLADAGPQFRDVLDRHGDRNAQAALLKTAMQEMVRLHGAGLAHGRPYMRDMTWKDDTLYFLDLEEDPVKVMPVATAQARDIWIFLSAACRYATIPGNKKRYEGRLIHDLFDVYAATANPAVIAELMTFVRFIAPLRKLLDRPFLWDKIGRDARQSVYVTRCLEEALGL